MPDSTAVVTPERLSAQALWLAPTGRSRFRGGGTYLYLLPSLAFLAIFTYYPIAFSTYLSLFRWNVLNPDKVFVGLANYLTLWH